MYNMCLQINTLLLEYALNVYFLVMTFLVRYIVIEWQENMREPIYYLGNRVK